MGIRPAIDYITFGFRIRLYGYPGIRHPAAEVIYSSRSIFHTASVPPSTPALPAEGGEGHIRRTYHNGHMEGVPAAPYDIAKNG